MYVKLDGMQGSYAAVVDWSVMFYACFIFYA